MAFIKTSKTQRVVERSARKQGIISEQRKREILAESGNDPRVRAMAAHYGQEAAKAKAEKKAAYENHAEVQRHRSLSKDERHAEAVELTAKSLHEYDKFKMGDKARYEDAHKRAEGYANVTERKAKGE